MPNLTFRCCQLGLRGPRVTCSPAYKTRGVDPRSWPLLQRPCSIAEAPRTLPKQDLGLASPGVRPLTPLYRFPAECPLLSSRGSTTGRPCANAPKRSQEADGANHRPRSVLVVSHHLDGLLHSAGRRLVASCYRSWGSPAFLVGRFLVPTRKSIPGSAPTALAARFIPFKEFPSSVAAPHHCGPYLLAVHTPRGGDTSCDTRFRVPQLASPRGAPDFKAFLH
jgi:hypothetical protein